MTAKTMKIKQTKLFFKMLLGNDPQANENVERTEKLHATVDGEINWMKCRPKFSQTNHIECENGKTYKPADDNETE